MKIGLVIFMLIAGTAFWILLFLAKLLPIWNIMVTLEKRAEKKANVFEGRE